jgi:hypothetical protein
VSAESEEMRETAATAAHVAQARRPSGQWSARIVPRKVATPFPPRKPSQTGQRWPRKAKTRDLCRVLPHEEAGGDDGDGALARVEDEGEEGREPIAGAEHVGRADVARADLADVAQPHRAGDDDAEGDGAEEVGQRRDDQEDEGGRGEVGHLSLRRRCRPATQVARTLPCMRWPSKGVFFDFDLSVKRSSTKGAFASNSDEVRGRAFGEAARGKAQPPRRVERHGAEERRQVEVARVVEAEGGGEERLEPHGAGGGLLERQALALFVLRGVHGGDDVDQPLGHGLHHRHAVVLGPERRLHLEEGAVVAHVEFVERQVVDRHARRDVEARGLRAADPAERAGGGDLVGVVAHARHLHEREVAVEAHAFGHRADRGQALERGELAGGGRGTH